MGIGESSGSGSNEGIEIDCYRVVLPNVDGELYFYPKLSPPDLLLMHRSVSVLW